MLEGINGSSKAYGVPEILDSQYEVIAGRWTDFNKSAADYRRDGYGEVVLIVDSNSEISQLALYALGLCDKKDLISAIKKMIEGEEIALSTEDYSYEEVLDWSFKLLLTGDLYESNNVK